MRIPRGFQVIVVSGAEAGPQHEWYCEPGPLNRAEASQLVGVTREEQLPVLASGIFQLLHCAIHPNEHVVQEIPVTAFD